MLAACGGSAAPAASQPASATGSAAAKPSTAAPAGAASAPASPSAKPAAGGSAGTAAPVPSGVTPINVAFAASAAVYDPWYIAMEKGYDVEEGIKIQMTQAGGGVSTPALISNKLDYSTSAASAFSAVLKGAPLKIIFTNADKPQYRLYSTSKDIKTLADLKGKSVAVQSRGDTFEIATRIELLKNGIDPNSVSYTPLGTGGALLAAFKGGSVAASLLNTADMAELGDAVNKGNLLADLQKDVSMLYMGIATNDQKLQKDRDQVLRFTRATVKGREYMKAFRDQAIDILTKYNKRDRAGNADDYDQTIPLLTDDGTLTPEAQEFNAEVSAQILNMQKSQIPPIDKMYDYSLAKQAYADLKSAGWKPEK
ncbi:MAG TPA: ABC transporter substrate-binding protein [Chloroflexota bacterium]|nr:ABC transporter substrate-binding protein [Chloroflexota bacterium]